MASLAKFWISYFIHSCAMAIVVERELKTCGKGINNMHPLLVAIRKRPIEVLPEVSLKSFQHFVGGYSHRYAMEGISIDWQYNHDNFHDWLCARYQLKGAMSIADTTIVRSFARTEDEAFLKYFAL